MSVRTEIQERHDKRFGIDHTKTNQLLRLLHDREILLQQLDEISNLVDENCTTPRDIDEIINK